MNVLMPEQILWKLRNNILFGEVPAFFEVVISTDSRFSENSPEFSRPKVIYLEFSNAINIPCFYCDRVFIILWCKYKISAGNNFMFCNQRDLAQFLKLPDVLNFNMMSKENFIVAANKFLNELLIRNPRLDAHNMLIEYIDNLLALIIT
jgi:uncharacterized Zn-finger protein